MSTADQTPDRGGEPSAFPWGIPASPAPTPDGTDGRGFPPGAGPGYGAQQPTPPMPQQNPYQAPYQGPQSAQGPLAQGPQSPQDPQSPQAAPPFQAVYVPTGTYSQPAPPMMQSPYGAPLVQGDGRPQEPSRPALPNRNRVLLISVGVVAVVAAVIAYSRVSPPSQDRTKLTAQSQSGRPGGGADGAGAGPGGNALGAPGGQAAAGGQASVSATASGGKPDGPSGGINGGATASGVAPANPANPSAGGTTPAGGATTTAAPHPATTTAHTTPPPAAWHLASPPSPDCKYMDLPPSQLPQIQDGATGAEVEQLQCLLKKSMLNISTLAVDGQWGPATQSAFTQFQSCNNSTTQHPPDGPPPYRSLQLDGQAGPQSWTDLYYWDNQDFNGDAYYCNGFRHY